MKCCQTKIGEEFMIKLDLHRIILIKDIQNRIFSVLLEEEWEAWAVWVDLEHFLKIYLIFKAKINKNKMGHKK